MFVFTDPSVAHLKDMAKNNDYRWEEEVLPVYLEKRGKYFD